MITLILLNNLCNMIKKSPFTKKDKRIVKHIGAKSFGIQFILKGFTYTTANTISIRN